MFLLSGIIYTLITSKTQSLYYLFNKCVNIDNILKRKQSEKYRNEQRKSIHDANIISRKGVLFPIVNSSKNTQQNTNNQVEDTTNFAETEFNDVDGILMKVIEKDNSSTDKNYTFADDDDSKFSLRTNSYRTSINNSQKSQSQNLSGLRKRKPDLETTKSNQSRIYR